MMTETILALLCEILLHYFIDKVSLFIKYSQLLLQIEFYFTLPLEAHFLFICKFKRERGLIDRT